MQVDCLQKLSHVFLLSFLIAAISNGGLVGFTGSEALQLLGKVVLFFAITIVGFPLAVQHMKLVKVALLPFGHVMREVGD